MFDEIKANILKSKTRAFYRAAIRAKDEEAQYLTQCPHKTIVSTGYCNGIVEDVFFCPCCNKRIVSRDGKYYDDYQHEVHPEIVRGH